MKSEPEWLSANNVSPEIVRGKNVIVKGRMFGEASARLVVESENEEGKIVVSASYNSSPFSNTIDLAKFYLTQKEYDDFLDRGPKCVLESAALKTLAAEARGKQ